VSRKKDEQRDQELLLGCQISGYAKVLGGMALPQTSKAAGNATLSTCALGSNNYSNPMSYVNLECSSGYTGPLCGACSNDAEGQFAQRQIFVCEKCPAKIVSFLIVAAVVVATVITLGLTLHWALKDDAYMYAVVRPSDYIRIIILHVQYLAVMAGINTQWPTSLTWFLEACNAVVGTPVRSMGATCMADNNMASATIRIWGRPAFTYLLIAALVVYWIIWYRRRSSRAYSASVQHAHGRAGAFGEYDPKDSGPVAGLDDDVLGDGLDNVPISTPADDNNK
jgi:hypothetical protein